MPSRLRLGRVGSRLNVPAQVGLFDKFMKLSVPESDSGVHQTDLP